MISDIRLTRNETPSSSGIDIIWDIIISTSSTLSLVPFTTSFAGSHSDDSFAVALLFVNYVIMNVVFGSLYWYADWKKLLPHEFILANRKTGIYSVIGIIGLIVAIPIAYVNTYISFCLGIVIFSGHLIKKS